MNGHIRTREQWVDDLKSGRVNFHDIQRTSDNTRVEGNTAVEVGTIRTEGGSWRYMNVWNKRHGKWQLTAAQVTPTSGPAMR